MQVYLPTHHGKGGCNKIHVGRRQWPISNNIVLVIRNTDQQGMCWNVNEVGEREILSHMGICMDPASLCELAKHGKCAECQRELGPWQICKF